MQLFMLPVVQRRLNSLDEEQAALAARSREVMARVHAGIVRMLEGAREEGLAAVEAAMVELDRLQDRVLELA